MSKYSILTYFAPMQKETNNKKMKRTNGNGNAPLPIVYAKPIKVDENMYRHITTKENNEIISTALQEGATILQFDSTAHSQAFLSGALANLHPTKMA